MMVIKVTGSVKAIGHYFGIANNGEHQHEADNAVVFMVTVLTAFYYKAVTLFFFEREVLQNIVLFFRNNDEHNLS